MKKIIATPEAPAAVGPYSQAVEANGTLYISGQLPIDPATKSMPEGIQAQTLQSLKNIDIAFLAVNQPYTMTVDQAVEAVKILRPAIFYPYHYGEVEEKTDIERLARELEGITEVRIRPME